MALRNPTKRQKTSIKLPMMGNRKNPLPESLACSSPTSRIRSLDSLQLQPGKKVSFDQRPTRVSSAASFDRANSTASTSRAMSNGPSVSVPVAENDDDIQDREESDSLDEVIMAVDLRDKETVGCSYYVASEEKLYLMEDLKHGGIEVIDACKVIMLSLDQLLPVDRPNVTVVKLHVMPTTILLSSRVDESVESYLNHDQGIQESVNEGGRLVLASFVPLS